MKILELELLLVGFLLQLYTSACTSIKPFLAVVQIAQGMGYPNISAMLQLENVLKSVKKAKIFSDVEKSIMLASA